MKLWRVLRRLSLADELLRDYDREHEPRDYKALMESMTRAVATGMWARKENGVSVSEWRDATLRRAPEYRSELPDATP